MKALPYYLEFLHFALIRRWFLFFSTPRVLFVVLHRITKEPVWQDEYNLRPKDLDELLTKLLEDGFSFVTLDQAFSKEKLPSKSICFTCDDGFADNLLYGAPIFRKHGVPYAIYLPTGLVERRQISLEAVAEYIKNHPNWKSTAVPADCRAKDPENAGKQAIRFIAHAATLDETIRAKERFLQDNQTNLMEEMDHLYLNAAQVRKLARDPLCTLGAHSEHHVPMRKMNQKQLVENTVSCKERIEKLIQEPCRHFAYPFGGIDDNYFREFAAVKKAGFQSAVMFWNGIATKQMLSYGNILPRLDLSSQHSVEENLRLCREKWNQNRWKRIR